MKFKIEPVIFVFNIKHKILINFPNPTSNKMKIYTFKSYFFHGHLKSISRP